jgi:hypothetical protein
MADKWAYVGKIPPHARLPAAQSGAMHLSDSTTVPAGESQIKSQIIPETDGPPPARPKPYAFLQRSRECQDLPPDGVTEDGSPPERPKPYAFLQRSKVRHAIPSDGSVVSAMHQVRIIMDSHWK